MTLSAFNLIDFAILIIMAISILTGVLRGATREVLGVAGWIGAFATVFYGLPLFRPLGRQYIASPMVADAIVAVILFVLSLAVFILISRVIATGVRGSMLGGLDRSLGLVFGVVRGAFLVCFIYLLLSFFAPQGRIPDVIQEARFTPWVAKGAYKLRQLIPSEYLPKRDLSNTTINPLDAKDLIENLSTFKPTSPKKPEPQYDRQEQKHLENVIEEGEAPHEN